MNVIHITHGRANPHGHNGISRVVYYMNKYEKIHGINSQIWSIVDKVKSHYTYKRDNFVTVECFPRARIPFGKNEIIYELIKHKNSIDLVHFHLIWFYDKNIIASALKKADIPFIITTHGTYIKPHAYTGKRLLAKWLYEVTYLNMATEVHAITPDEAIGLRKYGFEGKTFIVPNGIDIEEIPVEKDSAFFSNKPYKDKIKFIWIGVLRTDKNLPSLIKAVSLLPDSIKKEVIFILIGPDYKNNAKKYQKLINDLGCANNFDYIGPLYGKDKYDAIESSDVFILPSFSEVFSLALLDAMACGKPCVVTEGCGVNSYIKNEFFISCPPTVKGISKAISDMISKRDRWVQMGKNARMLIEEELNWNKIAQVMIKNYKRIIRDGNLDR